MISDNKVWDDHISHCRWAVLTTLRQKGSPVSSIVAYARDGDELVVSTTFYTFKVSSLKRNPRLNLCVFNNEEPFSFVAIEGEAAVEQDDNLVSNTRLVFDAIEGTGYREPEDLEGWLRSQDRVILRIKPDRVYGVMR